MLHADSYHLSADQAIGITVNQVMFQKSVTRSELARRIELSQPSVSMKLRGQVGWSLEDLLLISEALAVDPREMLPAPDGEGGWLPATYMVRNAKSPVPAGTGPSDSVAGTGFEPATSGL